MPTYRMYKVRPDMRHGAGGRYGPGDTLELTENEAAGFLDKLLLVEDAPPSYDVEDDPGTAPALLDKMIEFGDELIEAMPVEDAAHIDFSTPDIDLMEDMSVKDVFDTPTWQAFEAAGIMRFGDVESMSDEEIVAVPGIGQVRLRLIRSIIAEVQGG